MTYDEVKDRLQANPGLKFYIKSWSPKKLWITGSATDVKIRLADGSFKTFEPNDKDLIRDDWREAW